MIAKDEKPHDETIENIRGYQTFILWKSTNTSLYNIQKLEVTVHARARMHSHVYTRSLSNLDPNIRLTFCDGDCIFLLFHTLPLLGETDLLSTSRKTYFLGYPDEVEIKGIAEIKGVSKIKEGQWRKIAEVWCPQHALVVTSRVCSSHPSFVFLSLLTCLLKYQERVSVWSSNVWFYFNTEEWLHMLYIRNIFITECLRENAIFFKPSEIKLLNLRCAPPQNQPEPHVL